MRASRLVVRLLGIGFFGPLTLPAQSVPRLLGADLANAGRDMVAIWASPLHASARDWSLVAATIGTAAVMSIGDDEVDRWAVRNQDAGSWRFLDDVRRGGALFGGHTVMPYVGAAYVLGIATNHRGTRDGIMGCAAAYGAQSLARSQVMYRLVARSRPVPKNAPDTGVFAAGARSGDQYQFGFPGKNDSNERSIPGGHVANGMACAAFLSERFHLGPVEPVLYAVAGGMGVGRLLDRGHWASDQFLGIVLGYATGRKVARRSLARVRGNGAADSTRSEALIDAVTITPSRDGVTMRWTLIF